MESVLRDLEREQSKMQTDVANFYRHYEKLAGFVRQHLEQSTIEWARLIASHPRSLLLVMETTRIVDEDGYATHRSSSEPIRFTTLALTSGEMWDQLLRPSHTRQVTGVEYHGLTIANLDDKLTMSEAWPNIMEQLEDRHLIILGADYVRQAVQSVYQTNVLNNAFCLHNKAKEFYGQFYDLSLEKIFAYQGIDRKREQLRDSRDRILMLAQVVNNFAAGMPKQSQEDEASDGLGDLEG